MTRALLAAAVLAAATPACSQALTLRGHASTYGNDSVAGVYDAGDSNQPALAGYANTSPAIAVMRWSTLGHWWRTCTPRRLCRWVRQTDIGPATWTGRVLDVNAVAARLLFQLRGGDAFPTDEGSWRLTLAARRLTSAQRRQFHEER